MREVICQRGIYTTLSSRDDTHISEALIKEREELANRNAPRLRDAMAEKQKDQEKVMGNGERIKERGVDDGSLDPRARESDASVGFLRRYIYHLISSSSDSPISEAMIKDGEEMASMNALRLTASDEMVQMQKDSVKVKGSGNEASDGSFNLTEDDIRETETGF